MAGEVLGEFEFAFADVTGVEKLDVRNQQLFSGFDGTARAVGKNTVTADEVTVWCTANGKWSNLRLLMVNRTRLCVPVPEEQRSDREQSKGSVRVDALLVAQTVGIGVDAACIVDDVIFRCGKLCRKDLLERFG